VLQELADREAIKDLKARYVRLVDTQDWDAWRDLFTDDLHVELEGMPALGGADDYVAAVQGMIGAARTVHHCHMPELDFDGPDDARGIWAQAVYIEWPTDGDRNGMRAFGHCHEAYRRVDGDWKIAAHRQTTIRIDPLYPEPLPESVLGGPPLLDEAEL